MAKRSFKPTNADERNMVLLPTSADDLPESVTVDLDAKDPNAFEIDVVDDTPEEDRGRPNARRLTGLEDEEDDLRNVSAKVQKRINRLRFEVESQVRERGSAERERDAAVNALREREEELRRLRQIAETGSTALASSMKAEREARITDAKRRIAEAHAVGNSEALATATTDLAKATTELEHINYSRPTPRQDEQRREQPAQTQQQRPTLKPNVAAWIAHNDRWFGKDQTKTKFAMSVHEAIMARGIDDGSPEYTRELDKGLKAVYPDHQSYGGATATNDDFDEDAGSRPRRTNAVEQGSRAERVGGPPENPRRVPLTRSELSLAKRLRLTPEQYAVEKLRYQQKGGA